MDDRAARAGADLALVQREQGEAFQRLVEEVVVLRHDVGEEDVRAFAAELDGARDDVLRGVLHDEAAGSCRAGERDLGDALVEGQRLAGFDAEAVDDVQDAGRQQVVDEVHEDHDAVGRLLGGLQHDAVAGGERRSQLPAGHQQREVPRDDLADDAERLVEVVGDGGVVDLADRAFLGAQAAGEVAEVVDGERDVGGHRFADRLAVVDRFDGRDLRNERFHAVGDLEQCGGAIGRRGLAPGGLGLVGGVEGDLDVLRARPGDLADDLAVDRRGVLEVLALHRRDPLAADEILVA